MTTGGPRGAIRLLAVAYASVAALVFLQTMVLQALSYDSPSFPVVVAIFRIAFLVADVLGLAAVVGLARKSTTTRPFTVLASSLAAFNVLSGLIGGLSHLVGGSSRDLRMLKNVAATTSAAEPSLALGALLLVAFALGAMLRAKAAPGATPPPSAPPAAAPLWVVFLVVASLWLFATLARASSRDAQTITMAWAVWALEIGKWALLAAYTLVVHRALASTAAASDVPKDNPYREGEGAPEKQEAPAPPDPATIAPLRRAASGMSLYSLGFALRIGAAVVLTPLTMAMGGSSDFWFLYLLLPLAGILTAGTMAIGLGRQRILPSLRSGGRLRAAAVFMWIAALFDGFVVLGIMLAATSGSSWSAHRKAQRMVEMGFPSTAFFFGIGVLLAAAALARVGETFDREALTRRARWAQALAVSVFASILALMATIAAINGQDYDQKNGGALVSGALFIAAVVATLAFVVMHVLSQAEATRMLRFRLGLAR